MTPCARYPHPLMGANAVNGIVGLTVVGIAMVAVWQTAHAGGFKRTPTRTPTRAARPGRSPGSGGRPAGHPARWPEPCAFGLDQVNQVDQVSIPMPGPNVEPRPWWHRFPVDQGDQGDQGDQVDQVVRPVADTALSAPTLHPPRSAN